MNAGRKPAARPRRRVIRSLAFIFSVLLTLPLLLGLTFYLLDDDDYRDLLVWSADFFLDSHLEIDGPFTIEFASEVELNAEQVSLQAHDGSYSLSFDKLYLQQRFGSYLRTGTLWFNKLSIDALQVAITPAPSDEEFDWQQLTVIPVVIEETRIDRLSLVYRDDDEQEHSVELENIVLDDENNQGALTVSASGQVNSHPMTLAGSLGSVAQLRKDQQRFPVEFSLRRSAAASGAATTDDGTVFQVAGTVDRTSPGKSVVEATFDLDLSAFFQLIEQASDARNLGHLQAEIKAANEHHDWNLHNIIFKVRETDLYRAKGVGTRTQSGAIILQSEFEVPDPAALAAQFGLDLGSYAAVTGNGEFSGNPDRISYRGKVSVGRSENDLAVTLALHGTRPAIQGKVNSEDLHLEDIGVTGQLSDLIIEMATRDSENNNNPDSEATAATETATPVAASGTDQADGLALVLDPLQEINLDLEISIDRLVGSDFAVDRMAGKISLADGRLRIDPMQITTAGGTADIKLALGGRKAPAVSLDIELENLQLDELLDEFPAELQGSGEVDLKLAINSRGQSPAEWFTNAKGNASANFEQVILPRTYLQALALVDPPVDENDAFNSVEIDATVSAKIGEILLLAANDTRIRTDDGRYELTLGKLKLQQDLSLYHEKKRVLIRDLELQDTHVQIVPDDSPGQVIDDDDEWHEGVWWGYVLPATIIEKMQLARLSLDYGSDDEPHKASIEYLNVDNSSSDKPVKLDGSGLYDAHVIKLDGSVGTPAQPRGDNLVYPIDFDLDVGSTAVPEGKTVIAVNGLIDRRKSGANQIDLQFSFSLSELATIFSRDITAEGLGRLEGEVSIVEEKGRWAVRRTELATKDTELWQYSMHGNLDDDHRLELNSALDIPDPEAFGAELGIDLAGIKSYRGRGVLSGSQNDSQYRGQVEIGRITSQTSLDFTRVNGKVLVKGKFEMPELYLQDLGLDFRLGADPDAPETDETDEPGKSAGPNEETAQQTPVEVAELQPLFSRDPIDFSGLHRFNLELEVAVGEIIGTDFAIDELAGNINLTDGLLRVAPMRLSLEGGETNLDLTLDARERPRIEFNMSAEGLVLGELISQVQTEVPVEGKAHVDVDVKTEGHSAHEFASGLNGDIGFGLENARLPQKYLKYLSADVFGWVIGIATFEDSHASIDCLILDFDTKQGIAKSNLLVADGPNLIVDGNATFDLQQETMDMYLRPKHKRGIKRNAAPVTISGPIRDPSVSTAAGQEAAAGIGGLVLLPEVFIPLGIVDVLWKKLFAGKESGRGCTDLVAKYEEEKQNAAQENSE